MSEQYVRPPVVGREAPSRRLALWWFRLMALLCAAALVLLVVLGYQRLIGANSEDPGLTNTHALTRPGAVQPRL